MIPNAVASTGVYAGFWSHLKSIDHALFRTLSIADPRKLTELDRDRLQALVDFLKGSLPVGSGSSYDADDLLLRCQTNEPDYSGAIDLRQEVSNIPAFEEWLKSSKKSFENKMHRLIKAVQDVLGEGAPDNLLPGIQRKEIPRTEFEVLRAILQSLLAETDIAFC